MWSNSNCVYVRQIHKLFLAPYIILSSVSLYVPIVVYNIYLVDISYVYQQSPVAAHKLDAVEFN